jgi:hypothetical protein
MEEEGDEGDKVRMDQGRSDKSRTPKPTNSPFSCLSQPYVVLQKPGEIVYVPSGWYHLVLNLEHSTAVTHNYADGENKGRVEEVSEAAALNSNPTTNTPSRQIWDVVKSEEGEFAKRWRKGIKEKRGDLEERIRRAERSEG